MVLAFIALLLVPLVLGVSARQVDLRILEMRVRLAQDVDIHNYEPGEHLHVLSRDEFFASLANIRNAAFGHSLEVASFAASEVDNFGMDVSETTVRASLSGCISDAVSYVFYLAGGVYNVRYLSLVNAETASIEVWLSIFHID